MLDIMMPEMNGYDLAAAIRRQEPPTGRRIPILAITASDFGLDEGKARSAGLDGYMAKPLNPKLLANKLTGIFCPSAKPDKP